MTTTAMVSSNQRSGNQAGGTQTAPAQIVPRGPALPTIITDEHRSILKSMVDRNASPAQVEMLIVIGNRYDLDPLMGHVVLINGKCFVTHKGLMHKAHASGVFDGLETTYGTDDLGDFCECHVFRKDMSRAFVGKIYIEEYRSAGPVWKQYPRAMAAKTAESFVLRRAFDVALTSQEEMGVADAPPPQRLYSAEEKTERKALSERIAGASKALTRQQFDAFKADVASSGGLPQMETEDLRRLLVQVEDVAAANVAQSDADAQLEAEGKQVAANAAADEDDPFANDGASGPEGG